MIMNLQPSEARQDSTTGRPAPSWRNGVVLLTALAAGCQHNTYELQLTPNGAVLQRKLSMWREASSGDKPKLVEFPEQELLRAAKAYGKKDIGPSAQIHRFSGAFAGRMPDDIGGAGTYTRWETQFGVACAYVERFRGNDDFGANLDKRKEAIRQLTGLLTGWLESEIGREPEFPRIRKFFAEELRRDLWNMSLYVWAFVSAPDEPAARPKAQQRDSAPPFAEEAVVRIALYLMERGYFKPESLPQIVRALGDLQEGDAAPALALLQRLIATKIGIAETDPIPPSLQFFTDETRLTNSLDQYLRSTRGREEELRKQDKETRGRTQPKAGAGQSEAAPAARSEQDDAGAPPHPAPTAEDVVGELLARAFLSDGEFFYVGDRLRVKLALPVKPFSCNGTWRPDDGAVTWERLMASSDRQPVQTPDVLFTFWAAPNKPFQQEHFAVTVLEEQQLAEYCLWRCGLRPEEAKQWDGFVAALRPNQDLIAKLEAFRFAGEPHDKPSRASTTLNVLIAKLRKPAAG